MPNPASDLANNFVAHIRTLEITRHKIEGLLQTGYLDREDAEQVYCGLYLNVFTEFEGLIEELFFGLLSSTIVSPNAVCVVPPSSSALAQQILMIGKSYLDWLPYDKTLERANIIFQDGRPFSLLQHNHKEKLLQFIKIRHVIAHKSNHAKQQFERGVIGTLTLLPRERTPVGFLMSRFRTNPVQTQYELVIQELESMAQLLCH